MSGPKIVHIVTKQEVMEICRGRIAAVQDMIERWRKCAAHHDVLTVENEKAIENRLLAIIKLFEREQFNDVQKNCLIEIAAVQTEISRIQNEAIEKAVLERSIRRRLQYTAETLVKTFKAEGCQIPEELSDIVSSVLTANKVELDIMTSTLNRILTEYTLSSSKEEKVNLLQKELSVRLAEGEKFQTLIDWKILHDKDEKTTENDRRLDKLLAEIEAMDSKAEAQPFLDRVTLITKESLLSQRSLLTDSLILDLVAHSNRRKIKEQAIVSMQEVRCELRRMVSKEAKNIESLLTNAIDSEDITSSKILNKKGIELIKKEAKAMAGMFRREAILKGLAELGYEIRENMATAWAKSGRIVVKKPHEKSYGVELGAIEDAERLQVQLVSFDQSNKDSQDRDRETIWCSEFYRLKDLLEKSGTALHIEKALPIGKKSLKKIHELSAFSVSEQTLNCLKRETTS